MVHNTHVFTWPSKQIWLFMASGIQNVKVISWLLLLQYYSYVMLLCRKIRFTNLYQFWIFKQGGYHVRKKVSVNIKLHLKIVLQTTMCVSLGLKRLFITYIYIELISIYFLYQYRTDVIFFFYKNKEKDSFIGFFRSYFEDVEIFNIGLREWF